MTCVRSSTLAAIAVMMWPITAMAQDAPHPIVALQAWIEAVTRHVPGAADRWADATARLRYADRLRLNDVMTTFLRAGIAARRGQPFAARGDIEAAASRLARDIDRNQGWEPFLKNASVLHADAAILLFRAGGINDPTRPHASPVPPGKFIGKIPAMAPPPLLTNVNWVSSQDGQVIGRMPAEWNWPFARSLIDVLREVTSSPEDAAAFAGDWYHAPSAFMLGNGLYAEATGHLGRAVTILPGDARLLFDRACYSELLGMPMQQILREETRRDQHVDLPERKAANADAERWFRAALEIDPGFSEARIRLARILTVEGKNDAAIAEIARALEDKLAGPVAYFAHLFGGRAEQAAGRLAAARRHYAEASALFPGAQSALLAQSQTALLDGDVAAALSFTKTLRDQDQSEGDPWWLYHVGPGRDTEPLFAALWRRAGS